MKLRSIALAAIVVSAAAPAFATTSATASLTGLSFQLIDLNPMDGIASSITFASGSGMGNYVYSAASANDYISGADNQSGSRSSNNVGVDRSITNTTDYSAATSTVTASGGKPTSLVSTGFATAPAGAGDASYNANAASPQNAWWGYSSFTLSGNTMLIVSGTSTVTASNSVGYTATGSESSSASTSAQLSGVGAAGSGNQSSSFSASASAPWWTGPYTETSTSSFSLIFGNTTGGNITGTMALATSVNGSANSSVAVVPEPETYAMMLAGLGAIGFMARRRRAA